MFFEHGFLPDISVNATIFWHASLYSNIELTRCLLLPLPLLYIERNDKLFTGQILRVEATPGNARQERIGATRREAVFKKFKRPVCQSRCIFFASRNLDIAQSVISRREISAGVSIFHSLIVRAK